jgi:hypothetical protein
MSNSVKIRSVGAELFHAGRHMTKLMVASRSSANAHKSGRIMIMCPVSHMLWYVVTEQILVPFVAGDLHGKKRGGGI